MLIRMIEKFLRSATMSPTVFGRLAMSDPRFVSDLRCGREPRPCTRERVEGFIAGYRAAEARGTKDRTHDA